MEYHESRQYLSCQDSKFKLKEILSLNQYQSASPNQLFHYRIMAYHPQSQRFLPNYEKLHCCFENPEDNEGIIFLLIRTELSPTIYPDHGNPLDQTGNCCFGPRFLYTIPLCFEKDNETYPELVEVIAKLYCRRIWLEKNLNGQPG